MTRLGSLVVLADHAAEDLPLPDWEVQRDGGLGFLVGRSLLAGLVRPVPVVVAGVLAEDRLQVAFVVDEDPVGALGSCCAYPPLGVQFARGVRGGAFTIFRPSLAKISSKAAVNLASRSRTRKLKELSPSLRSMIRLRAC
jgi:hypothetical protein